MEISWNCNDVLSEIFNEFSFCFIVMTLENYGYVRITLFPQTVMLKVNEIPSFFGSTSRKISLHVTSAQILTTRENFFEKRRANIIVSLRKDLQSYSRFKKRKDFLMFEHVRT